MRLFVLFVWFFFSAWENYPLNYAIRLADSSRSVGGGGGASAIYEPPFQLLRPGSYWSDLIGWKYFSF